MQRLNLLANQLSGHLLVTDNRTGKTVQVPISTSRESDFVNATKFSQLNFEGQPLRIYDPGYMNTICCTSKISYIDGDKGILEYRGYPIEQLAEKSSFIEVTYLLINGELPSRVQLQQWEEKIRRHTFIHNDASEMMKSFRYDAHPMGMLISTLATISTFHPDANPALAGEGVYKNKDIVNKQIFRLLGSLPTIAANSFRNRIGREYNFPAENTSYVENFLYMLDRLNEQEYRPNPKLVRALEILFILHAEHELNCSTAFVRHLSSSGVDVYTTIAGAAGALYGPKHGGANEAVLRMLEEIGELKNIPQFIQDVKDRKKLLMGFGHRVYKNYDPRAKIVKQVAEQVFEITGKEPLIEIAMELERIALSDQFFIQRKLYPNVDFYSGVIYRAMGFPTDMFPVLFTIPRVAGWLAHWKEYLEDKENNIIRPRQNYTGPQKRDYVGFDQRKEVQFSLYPPLVPNILGIGEKLEIEAQRDSLKLKQYYIIIKQVMIIKKNLKKPEKLIEAVNELDDSSNNASYQNMPKIDKAIQNKKRKNLGINVMQLAKEKQVVQPEKIRHIEQEDHKSGLTSINYIKQRTEKPDKLMEKYIKDKLKAADPLAYTGQEEHEITEQQKDVEILDEVRRIQQQFLLRNEEKDPSFYVGGIIEVNLSLEEEAKKAAQMEDLKRGQYLQTLIQGKPKKAPQVIIHPDEDEDKEEKAYKDLKHKFYQKGRIFKYQQMKRLSQNKEFEEELKKQYGS